MRETTKHLLRLISGHAGLKELLDEMEPKAVAPYTPGKTDPHSYALDCAYLAGKRQLYDAFKELVTKRELD